MDIRIPILISIGALAPIAGCARSDAPSARDPSQAEVWYCPMHPTYQTDRPADCPICNMKLIPRAAQDQTAPSSGVEGRAIVTLEADARRAIGVRTGVVERKPFTRTIRVGARVDFDERKLSAVTLRFGGYVDELFVRSVGDEVKKGDPLLALWSPELFEAQRAYQIGSSARAGNAGAESARKKLLAWDQTEEQVHALDGGAEPERRATVRSRFAGVVTRRTATTGAYVEAGSVLYELADLSTVWVLASVHEGEIPLVRVGQAADVELASLGGEPVRGTVQYVYPFLDETTRTARVRVEVANAEGRLKPGMLAVVSIAVDLGEQVVIDTEAILDTGTRRIVFVETEPGRFEPREISIGDRSGGRAVVTKGVEPGEIVVTSANFLVDSESRLRSALEQHTAGEARHEHH